MNVFCQLSVLDSYYLCTVEINFDFIGKNDKKQLIIKQTN